MIKFLQEKLGYGLAGFFVVLAGIAAFGKASKAEIPGEALWLSVAGFILGLVLPKRMIAPIFMGVIGARAKIPLGQDTVNPDQHERGFMVNLVRIFGMALLIFLIYLVFIMLRAEN